MAAAKGGAATSDVADKTECRLFTGALDTGGYGLIRIRGKLWKAHRLSWTIAYGPIPEGLNVCHKCDVRNCTNVDHLFLGTDQDNMADRDAKGRHIALLGSSHGMHKLTDGDVQEIRRRYSEGESLARLAAEFCVHPATVHRAATRRSWRHLP